MIRTTQNHEALVSDDDDDEMMLIIMMSLSFGTRVYRDSFVSL